MRRRWSALVLCLAHAPLLSCSVMGLDDFGTGRCTLDEDCVKATPLLSPSPSACGKAVCRDGLCQWQQGVEICDGKDNDCDGLIDNHLDFPASSRFSGEAVDAKVAFALSPDAKRNVVTVAVDGDAQGFTLAADSSVSPSTVLSYQSESAPSGSCPNQNSAEGAGCNFSELALAADDAHVVFASINTLGCAAGQLRVGLSNIDQPFTVSLGKFGRQLGEEGSNIELGVAVTEGVNNDGACSGAAGVRTPGATQPAVAAVDTNANGSGALVVWLAAASDDSGVPADYIPVEALGLVVPTAPPLWLDGSDRGAPQELGRTTSRSAPAVLALKSPVGSGKYLVAFPAEQNGSRGIQPITVQVSKLQLTYEKLAFLNVRAADQVSLAPGRAESDEVGLAWRAADEGQLCFTTVSSADARQLSPVLHIAASDPTFPAQILHRDTGFAMVEPTGGWFLSWGETTPDGARSSQLARVRDGASESMIRRTLGAGGAPTLLYPSTIDGGWSVGYALITQAAANQTTLAPNSEWCH